MFGLVISGRPVDADPQAISETQYAFQVSPSPPFTSIVLFLLPGVALPPGAAVSVYVQIPPSQDFQLVGAIGTGKESAIYKLNRTAIDAAAAAMNTYDMAQTAPSIVIGLSIEPATQVEAQLTQMKGGQAQSSTALVPAQSVQVSPATTKVLAQRIGRNAFNFLSSFGTDMVPLKAFQDWWEKFEKKLELDPTFLEREQG